MPSPSARVIGTPRWKRVRAKILDRDGWRCVKCGQAGKLEVDHVVSISKGGDPWEPVNLQALCRGCHIAKTRQENRKPLSPEVEAWAQLVADLLGGSDGC